MTRRATVVALVALGTALSTVVPGAAAASGAVRPAVLAPSTIPVPRVEGPITGPGSPSIISTTFDLASVGYREDEYFISGTAARYAMVGAFAADGRWKVRRGATATYKTRLLVYRPIDARRFNGTVVVEWFNDTEGSDTAPDWIQDHTELIRQGFAYVGVSAQALGVNGGTSVLQVGGSGLRKTNPARYGTLHHPGDAYSYDIFSQAAQAIRHPRGVSVLGGLKPKALIADGESQSAFYLTTYIDAVAPVAHVFNGYLLHSRWGGGTSLSGPLDLGVHEPFRTDLAVPVLAFETESDLLAGYASDRQPDNRWFRDWEVAGTSHADDYTTIGIADNGRSNAASAILDEDTPLGILGCTSAPNAGPGHWVLDAAAVALNRWVRTGRAPPHGSRLELTSGSLPKIRRDSLGNALGGIRTPELDVPIAALTGTAAAGQGVTCQFFGSTTPFDEATLTSLYPTHADYVAKFDAATRRAVTAGFILSPDATEIEAAAAASSVP